MKLNKYFAKATSVLLSCILVPMVWGCGKNTKDSQENVTDNSAIDSTETNVDNQNSDGGLNAGNTQPEEVTEPWIFLDDGITVHCIGTSIDSYINDGYDYANAAHNYYLGQIHKTYADMDCIVIDFEDSNSIIETSMSGDKLTGITVAGSDGRKLRFEAKNVRLSDSGELIFDGDAELTLLTHIDGIAYVAPFISYAIQDGPWADSMYAYSAVSPAKADEVESSSELLYKDLAGCIAWEGYSCIYTDTGYGFFMLTTESSNQDEVRISSLAIRYSGVRHDIGKITLNTDFYGYLAEGDYYDTGKERWNADEGALDFYMMIKTDNELVLKYDVDSSIYGTSEYKIGDLYDATGAVKDKSEPLALGDYLMVDLKGVPYKVDLPIYSIYSPENLNCNMPASTVPDLDEINVLVVPYYFEDQQDVLASDMDKIKAVLGRTVTADGQIVDNGASGNYFTFSDYYDKASYGKLKITSYLTEWYKLSDRFFSDYRDMPMAAMDVLAIQNWINTDYSEWVSKLDQNSDGLFDAVIFVCASGEDLGYYTTISNGGAVSTVDDYTYDNALSGGKAAINHYVVINSAHLGTDETVYSGALIHEFGHQIGLIDYYDVGYTGTDAVGQFDMQSTNVGDWNPFSKFAAGWTDPTVIKPEDIGDEIIVTISKFELSGDTIIIPTSNAVYNADGSLNPFNEYIMIDLYSTDGLNEYDAPSFGLSKTGVRIYHVDARLIGIPIATTDGSMIVGDYIHNNSYSENGLYAVEVIQKGGVNTFTSLNRATTALSNNDLFYAGESFSMAKHKGFFLNGLMDDKTEFPYTITVVSIDGDEATIRISK